VRALHEALSDDLGVQLIVILEEDVLITSNTLPLFTAFLAHWHCNESLKDTFYVALTYDPTNTKYTEMLNRKESFSINRSSCAQLTIRDLPQYTDRDGCSGQGFKYGFVGQGARALAYSTEFARAVVSQRINNVYDLHLLQLVTERAKNLANRGNFLLAALCRPFIFAVHAQLDERCRGSEKLKSLTVNPSEETASYLCLDLSSVKSVMSRLHSLMVLLVYGSLHRLGLYVLWPALGTISDRLETIGRVDLDGLPFSTVPFVRVSANEKDQLWKHALSATGWCKGYINGWIPLELGVQHLLCFYQHQSSEHHRVKALFPSVSLACSKDHQAEMWNSFVISKAVERFGQEYISSCMKVGKKHVVVEDLMLEVPGFSVDLFAACMHEYVLFLFGGHLL
jgi:hypothetical protein